jgi:hypothetical protein
VTPEEWAAMMPPGIRDIHAMVLIYCPTADAYPQPVDRCQPGAEPLAVVLTGPADPAAMLPDAQLAALLRGLATRHSGMAEAADGQLAAWLGRN